MKLKDIRKYMQSAAFLMVALLTTAGFTSCESLHEDLRACDSGLRLRFVYDYNMEFADAFSRQVDCVTVFFYDEGGDLIETRIVTGPELADPDWRMDVDLPAGSYSVLAYGGMGCEHSSFMFETNRVDNSLYGVRVSLDQSLLEVPDINKGDEDTEEVRGSLLHPHFHGLAEVTVPKNSVDFTEATVYLMKNTNSIRVLLQHVDGLPLDPYGFDFRIDADNTVAGWDNAIIPQGSVSHLPWTRGGGSPGDLPSGSEASVVFAELSIPRITTGEAPRLVVTRRTDGLPAIDIPLVNYLLLLKSAQFTQMGSQEYLDRESRWTMIFFLDKNLNWLKTSVVINDWVIRLNNSEL